MRPMTNLESSVAWDAYDVSILFLATVGVFVNGLSLVLLRKKSSMFHNLLKLLAMTDLSVVVGCALLYALPDLWYYYNKKIYPVILPYLLPIVQIAMMTSVYTTIVMSFERYVRIGHTCRFRNCTYITKENFKYYVFSIIICPMLFYIPKFFELRTTYERYPIRVNIDCSFAYANNSSVNGFEAQALLRDQCLKFNFEEGHRKLANITEFVEMVNVESTSLKENQLYFVIYCIGLNTIFASMLPLISLLYFNIYTIKVLRKMGVENDCAAKSRFKNSQHRLLSASTDAGHTSRRGPNFSRKALRSTKTLEIHIVKQRETSEIGLAPTASTTATTSRPGRLTRSIKSRLVRMKFVSETCELRRLSAGSFLRPRALDSEVSTTTRSSGGGGGPRNRARSESHGDYSPTKRNEWLIKRRNGQLEHCDDLVSGKERHKMRRRRRRNVGHGTRKRSNSAPDELLIRDPLLQQSRPDADSSSEAETIVRPTRFGLRLGSPDEQLGTNYPRTRHPPRVAQQDNLWRRGESRLTRIASAIVWLFLFCHCWRLIPTLYEAIYDPIAWPNWLRHIGDISHTLIVFNSAVNFLLYKCL